MESILFVCVHNAGRSQMAEAIFRHESAVSGLDATVESAGTLGGGLINPTASVALEELGLSLASHQPKALTQEMVSRATRIISMGCGVDAAACPAKFLVTEDWGLDDPAGQPIERVRAIRDEIVLRVRALVEELRR